MLYSKNLVELLYHDHILYDWPDEIYFENANISIAQTYFHLHPLDGGACSNRNQCVRVFMMQQIKLVGMYLQFPLLSFTSSFYQFRNGRYHFLCVA